jgi:hypothetical protein
MSDLEEQRRRIGNLDRPIWAALATSHASLGYGNELARRYYPDVVPFAAVVAETPEAFRALADLLQPDEHVGLLSTGCGFSEGAKFVCKPYQDWIL